MSLSARDGTETPHQLAAAAAASPRSTLSGYCVGVPAEGRSRAATDASVYAPVDVNARPDDKPADSHRLISPGGKYACLPSVVTA